MADYFEDERGWINDLAGGDDWAVTQIFTKKGAVRGNHYHNRTIQITHVISGELYVVHGRYTPPGSRRTRKRPTETFTAGTQFEDMPGEPHAWQALEDTVCIVVTHGPRSGSNYEADTIRLEGDDRLL